MSEPVSAAPDRVIEVRDVSKAFVVGGARNVVFDRVSLSVERGAFVALVGPSGCGKSTLLRLVSGLEATSAGAVVFNGRAITGPPKGMIYVFQQYAKSIFPWRTVIQNVAFGLQSQSRVSGREAKRRALDYLSLVGLQGYENYYPHQLSGGMQQRVVIARALICEPAVLLMDEPFSAVDAMTRALLQELILSIWSRLSITILFVTHDIEEAVFLSNRIVALGRGATGVAQDIANPCAYPRDPVSTPQDPDFIRIRRELFAGIFQQEKDVLAHAPERPAA